jgi:hypothetical protein
MVVSTVTSFGCNSTSPNFSIIICGILDMTVSFHRTQPYLLSLQALTSVEYILQKRNKVQRIWVTKIAELLRYSQ